MAAAKSPFVPVFAVAEIAGMGLPEKQIDQRRGFINRLFQNAEFAGFCTQ